MTWSDPPRPTDFAGQCRHARLSVTLNANFTNRTVDAGVTVNINNQTWNGTANGVPIYRDQYFFAAAGNRINGIPGPALFNISIAHRTARHNSGVAALMDSSLAHRARRGMMYNMNGIAGAIAFIKRRGRLVAFWHVLPVPALLPRRNRRLAGVLAMKPLWYS